MDIKILIALHKPYQVPSARCYMPLQVGAVGKGAICENRDDTGDNISEKNPYFCELTALYWAWKNLDAEAIGLVHYRRYFSAKRKTYIKKHGPFASVLADDEVEALLVRGDIVVPKKRKYYIETLYSHYAHTLDASHLDIARDIVAQMYPDYLSYVDQAYNATSGYMFNMAIMKKEYLDAYCKWIFDILFELENRVDVTGMDAFSARLFGRVSEILFNAWILKAIDEKVAVVETAVIDMEPVNWIKKGWGFLAAKFFGKKYTRSM